MDNLQKKFRLYDADSYQLLFIKDLKVISYKNGNKNKCDKYKEQANKEKLNIAITFF